MVMGCTGNSGGEEAEFGERWGGEGSTEERGGSGNGNGRGRCDVVESWETGKLER